jgi:hypothetical protein
MKFLFSTMIVAGIISCSTPKNESIISQAPASATKDTLKTVADVVAKQEVTQLQTGDLREEKGEWVYTISNEYSFVSSPYDFDLNSATIESMLGAQAKTSVEEVEGGDDYDAYSISTVTFKDSKISFYSYPGKHSADIYTDLLPFKNGIKVGMTKQEFMKAMAIGGEDALKATVYELTDDYGYVKFSFRDDKLHNIYVTYEEGD